MATDIVVERPCREKCIPGPFTATRSFPQRLHMAKHQNLHRANERQTSFAWVGWSRLPTTTAFVGPAAFFQSITSSV